MKSDKSLRMGNPAELIERLKQNVNVLGILEYGSGGWGQGADTDLCVVVADRPDGLESVHFWLECGAVDLNVRTLEELKAGGVAPGFDGVLCGGRILYERAPGTLANSPADTSSGPVPLESRAVAFMRHGHAHYLHKLDHYQQRDPLLCNVLLCGAVHWLLHAYVSVRGLGYCGERAVLEAMAADEADLLPDVETASGAGSLQERIEGLCRLTDKVLAPVGGAWQPGEVLFFAEQGKEMPAEDEWRDYFASLIRLSQLSS